MHALILGLPGTASCATGPIFGSDQIFWECREHNACELYPRGLPSIIYRDFRLRFKFSSLEHVFLQDTAIGECMNNTVSVQAHWAILIEVYSTTSLTFPGDKLIAISGVAKKYRHETNDEYVAGMWRKDLANWILWYVRQWPSPRPLVYRAPTWSWASVDNVIGTQRGNLTGMIATVTISSFVTRLKIIRGQLRTVGLILLDL